MEKKLVLPGEPVAAIEEAEAGDNCFVENDIVFSSAVGETVTAEGRASVVIKARLLEQPHVGMDVYGVVTKNSTNKAVVGCIPVTEAEGKGRGVEMEAILPVTAVRRGYVEDMRREVKIGDIIKARVAKVTRTGVELTIFPQGYGVVQAFCPRCRDAMDLKAGIFICSSCGWKERRKLVDSAPPQRSREEGY